MPGRRRSAALQSFSLRKPSDVDIVLDDEDEHCFVSSYTTLDKIAGQVLVRCGKDTSFHELEISFEGVTETCKDPQTQKGAHKDLGHCIYSTWSMED